ncbi:MAG TPA: 3-deoxy-D-manno-octulosonic acid transferase [Methylomirabilota bacterium]|nr:3-deoxy-D-manno-octulosonic acid transferase [Methylomirabilota bacterium]
MYAVYTAAFAAAVTGYAPVALARRLARGVPLNLRERLGLGRHAPPAAPCGWIHAVSVGEAIAAAPLVEGLRRTWPALPLVVSTVTETGARVVRERFAGLAHHRYLPLDFPGAVRRVIASLEPAFFIGMETELWPNLLRALAARRVPTMIANGRLSDRSFRRYRLVRGAVRGMLGHVTVFAMQSDEDARRVIALGAPPERVVVTGNLKHEPLPDPAGVADLWHRLLGLAPGQPVWIAGSTHRGEEQAVLDAHRQALAGRSDLVLVLAPRHPERVGEVMGLVTSRGFAPVRRSQLPRARPRRGSGPAPSERAGRPPAASGIIVLDTVGELAALYSIADVVFVGGSLAPLGGHNMLEPALRGKPVLFGPHTTNFREAAEILVAGGGGLVVRDAGELAVELRRLLDDPARCARVGAAAREAAASRHGAARATLELVARYLRPDGTG